MIFRLGPALSANTSFTAVLQRRTAIIRSSAIAILRATKPRSQRILLMMDTNFSSGDEAEVVDSDEGLLNSSSSELEFDSSRVSRRYDRRLSPLAPAFVPRPPVSVADEDMADTASPGKDEGLPTIPTSANAQAAAPIPAICPLGSTPVPPAGLAMSPSSAFTPIQAQPPTRRDTGMAALPTATVGSWAAEVDAELPLPPPPAKSGDVAAQPTTPPPDAAALAADAAAPPDESEASGPSSRTRRRRAQRAAARAAKDTPASTVRMMPSSPPAKQPPLDIRPQGARHRPPLATARTDAPSPGTVLASGLSRLQMSRPPMPPAATRAVLATVETRASARCRETAKTSSTATASAANPPRGHRETVLIDPLPLRKQPLSSARKMAEKKAKEAASTATTAAATSTDAPPAPSQATPTPSPPLPAVGRSPPPPRQKAPSPPPPSFAARSTPPPLPARRRSPPPPAPTRATATAPTAPRRPAPTRSVPTLQHASTAVLPRLDTAGYTSPTARGTKRASNGSATTKQPPSTSHQPPKRRKRRGGRILLALRDIGVSWDDWHLGRVRVTFTEMADGTLRATPCAALPPLQPPWPAYPPMPFSPPGIHPPPPTWPPLPPPPPNAWAPPPAFPAAPAPPPFGPPPEMVAQAVTAAMQAIYGPYYQPPQQ